MRRVIRLEWRNIADKIHRRNSNRPVKLMRAFVYSLVAGVLLFLSSLPARAVRINLGNDGVEQYFYILELYILPALVVITVVLLCGYIAGRFFNRRSKNDAPAEEPSAELEKEEGTAAFLKELRSTPPIRDAEPVVPHAADDVGATVARDAGGNTVLEHEENAQFRLAAVGDEILDSTVMADPSPDSIQATPDTPPGRADRNTEPAMTTESTATAAALLARISRKKSASARRLSEVIDAPSEDAAVSKAPVDATDHGPGTGEDSGRGFSALLADAKSEALDRVPEALLLGELPKEMTQQASGTAEEQPGLGESASPEQDTSLEHTGPPYVESGRRRNNAPNLSLLAMVPDAGTETPPSASGPVQNAPPGAAIDEVLDLSLEATSAEFAEDEVLDLTQGSLDDAPDVEALDLIDEAISETPFEGALELLEGTTVEEPATAELKAAMEVSSDDALELTQEVSTSEPLEGEPEPRLETAVEDPSDEVQTNTGLHLPQDLTPLLPTQTEEEDLPTSAAEIGFAGASEAVTFNLPENLQDVVPSNVSHDPVPGIPLESQSEVVGKHPEISNGNLDTDQGGGGPADSDLGHNKVEPTPDPMPHHSAPPEDDAAELLNPFKPGTEKIDAATPLQVEPADTTIHAVDQQSGKEPARPEQPSAAPTHESLVERILRRQLASNVGVDDTPSELDGSGSEKAPREALWATEPPTAPLPEGGAAEPGLSVAAPTPSSVEVVSGEERNTDEPLDDAPSRTDAFSDPLFLNELLGDGNITGDPASVAEAATFDVPPENSDRETADPVSAAEPEIIDSLPSMDEPTPSEEWTAAAEDILGEAEAAPVVSDEPIVSVDAIAASEEPMGDVVVPAASEPEQQPKTPVVIEDSEIPDSASDDPEPAELTPPMPSIVERPTVWHESATAGSERRAEREDAVVEPWSPQPALAPRGVEDAQEAARRLAEGFEATATAMRDVMVSLDEKIKVQKGMNLDDIAVMRIAGVEGLDNATDDLAVFGPDLGGEINEGAAVLDKFNHVVDRLTEMAAAQDLDEGWNELVRQRISEALYTVEKIQEKVAAVLPPDNDAAEKSKDANAPSAMG